MLMPAGLCGAFSQTEQRSGDPSRMQMTYIHVHEIYNRLTETSEVDSKKMGVEDFWCLCHLLLPVLAWQLSLEPAPHPLLLPTLHT